MDKRTDEFAATEEADFQQIDLDLSGGRNNGEHSLIREDSGESAGTPKPTGTLGGPIGGGGWVKVWRRVEVGLLVGLIVVVWALLLLPVLFYHLPGEEVGAYVHTPARTSTYVCERIK